MGTGGYDVGMGLGIRCNDWVGSFVKIPFDHLKDVAGLQWSHPSAHFAAQSLTGFLGKLFDCNSIQTTLRLSYKIFSYLGPFTLLWKLVETSSTAFLKTSDGLCNFFVQSSSEVSLLNEVNLIGCHGCSARLFFFLRPALVGWVLLLKGIKLVLCLLPLALITLSWFFILCPTLRRTPSD